MSEIINSNLGTLPLTYDFFTGSYFCCQEYKDNLVIAAVTTNSSDPAAINLLKYDGAVFTQVGTSLPLEYRIILGSYFCCQKYNDEVVIAAASSGPGNASVSLFKYDGALFLHVGDRSLQYNSFEGSYFCCQLYNNSVIIIAASSDNNNLASVTLYSYDGFSFSKIADVPLTYEIIQDNYFCCTQYQNSILVAAASANGLAPASITLIKYNGVATIIADLALQYPNFEGSYFCCKEYNGNLIIVAASTDITDASISLFKYDGINATNIGHLPLQHSSILGGYFCCVEHNNTLFISAVSFDPGFTPSVSLFKYDDHNFSKIGDSPLPGERIFGDYFCFRIYKNDLIIVATTTNLFNPAIVTLLKYDGNALTKVGDINLAYFDFCGGYFCCREYMGKLVIAAVSNNDDIESPSGITLGEYDGNAFRKVDDLSLSLSDFTDNNFFCVIFNNELIIAAGSADGTSSAVVNLFKYDGIHFKHFGDIPLQYQFLGGSYLCSSKFNCELYIAAASFDITSNPAGVTLNKLVNDKEINLFIEGPKTICIGGNAKLIAKSDAAKPITYLWSTGAATKSITVSQAGKYTLSIVDDDGCVASAMHSISLSKSSSEIDVSIRPNPATVLENIIITVKIIPKECKQIDTFITSASFSGSITLLEGNTFLGSAEVSSNGIATLIIAGLTIGTHIITVEYSGDDSLLPSTQEIVIVITPSLLPATKESHFISTDYTYDWSVSYSQHDFRIELDLDDSN